MADAVREIVSCVERYRSRATEFSARWLQRHTPDLLVSRLLAESERSAEPLIETARTEALP